jgi:hypothetical protein
MINLKNWDITRVIKAIAGTTGVVLAIIFNSLILGGFGVLFLFQAITNTGCGVCATSSCTINPADKTKNTL